MFYDRPYKPIDRDLTNDESKLIRKIFDYLDVEMEPIWHDDPIWMMEGHKEPREVYLHAINRTFRKIKNKMEEDNYINSFVSECENIMSQRLEEVLEDNTLVAYLTKDNYQLFKMDAEDMVEDLRSYLEDSYIQYDDDSVGKLIISNEDWSDTIITDSPNEYVDYFIENVLRESL